MDKNIKAIPDTDTSLFKNLSNHNEPGPGPSGTGVRVFYKTECHEGSFNEWTSDYNLGRATNFRRNMDCPILAAAEAEYDNNRTVPIGDNVNLVISPDLTITFEKVLSPGSISINKTEDYFAFSTTATTIGSIGFSMSRPDNFVAGQEIVGLAPDKSLTSLPLSLVDNKINCSNIFTNKTHYGKYKIPLQVFSEENCEMGTMCPGGCIPDANWFCCPDNIYIAESPEYCPGAGYYIQNVAYDAQTYHVADTTPRVGACVIFGFAPAGFGFVAQFGQHYINLISAHSDEAYFVNSKESKIDLGPYVSTSYLNFHPEPIISAQADEDPVFDDDPVIKPVVTDLFFRPCENPYYTRGGYNIHDAFTFECGCWTTVFTRKDVLDIGMLIAALLLRIKNLYALLDVLTVEHTSVGSFITVLEGRQTNANRDVGYYKKLCDDITKYYPEIPSGFPPDGFMVQCENSLANPGPDCVLKWVDRFPDGSFVEKGTWEEYLEQHPYDYDNHQLDTMYQTWQLFQTNWNFMLDAEQDAAVLGKAIAEQKGILAAIWQRILVIIAELAGLAALLAAYQKLLEDFMREPAISKRQQCEEGFDFCAWNGTYDVCGGVNLEDIKQERGYWRRGYDPDGVQSIMPQGWPSCDCCHPCEPCHNPPPDGENGVVCPTCPQGWANMGFKFVGFLDPSMSVPNPPNADPCLNGETYVCCPPVEPGSPYADGPYWMGSPAGCVYFYADLGSTDADGNYPFQDGVAAPNLHITKAYREGKRCDDGDCVGYCD